MSIQKSIRPFRASESLEVPEVDPIRVIRLGSSLQGHLETTRLKDHASINHFDSHRRLGGLIDWEATKLIGRLNPIPFKNSSKMCGTGGTVCHSGKVIMIRVYSPGIECITLYSEEKGADIHASCPVPRNGAIFPPMNPY